MPPRLGLYSLANTPEELLSQGYGMVGTEFAEDPAFGNLSYNTVYNPAPYTGNFPFQNVFRISEGVSNNFDNPSFGGISGYRNVGGIDTLPAIQKDFRDYSFQDFYNYNTRDEYDPEKDDYQVRQIQGPEKKGIAKLMEVLGNIPTPLNLLRKAFEGRGPGFIGPKGSRAYGDESLFSTFGRSKTGAEFFRNLRDRKARQEAAARGAAKQADQARIDAFRAFRDSQPSGGGGGGGIGSSYGGAASPGSKGPGGSDEMGSF